MHELPIIEDVLSIATDFAVENNAKKILKISISASCFSGIIPEWCKLFFKMITEGTIAEGAELEVDLKPGKMFCHQCKKIWYTDQVSSDIRCPVCNSDRQQLLPYQKLRIETIEILENGCEEDIEECLEQGDE